MIRNTSFKHGWFYHYRVHITKTEELCEEYPALSNFLDSMFTACPDEKFTEGPRSSALRFPIEAPVTEIAGHEVCSLARAGLEWAKYKTAHSNVQVFMLEQDDKTLGVEVPLWAEPSELGLRDGFFDKEGPLSGHIDVLRVENGKIWIWDYKPNAHREKYAHTQVYFYARMMAHRLGMPLENFMCGYFDDQLAFVFDPCKASC